MTTLTPFNNSTTENKEIYRQLRKNTSTHDIYNRLHSINRDLDFVQKVAEEWYLSQFKVLPNQRCGTWYVDPLKTTSSSSTYAYFKSTDGHTNAWSFSIRRANLGLVQFAMDEGGFVIVDSTRRGKRMPDALSKTIPIWCTVINRAALKLDPKLQEEEWNTNLYTPPNIVSAQEKSQIEEKIDTWVQELLSSSLTIPKLDRPLRPIFIHPGTTFPPTVPLPRETMKPEYVPIICLSASTFIPHGGPETVRDSFGAFEYVQGSGDDDELWGKGLKPAHFFENRETLLGAAKEELPGVVDRVLGEVGNGGPAAMKGLESWVQVPQGSGIWLGTTGAGGLPALERGFGVVTFIRSDSPGLELGRIEGSSPVIEELVIRLQEGKRKKSDLGFSTQVLPPVVEFADRMRAQGKDVVVRDWDGKSLSVGVAVVLCWRWIGDDGAPRSDFGSRLVATKEDMRKRLEWVLNLRQGANPSRLVLKSINEYTMSALYK